jgi:hypothetical protein
LIVDWRWCSQAATNNQQYSPPVIDRHQSAMIVALSA